MSFSDMIAGILGYLMIISVIWGVFGLMKPRYMLWWAIGEKQTRGRVVGFTLTLLIVLFCYAMVFSPGSPWWLWVLPIGATFFLFLMVSMFRMTKEEIQTQIQTQKQEEQEKREKEKMGMTRMVYSSDFERQYEVRPFLSICSCPDWDKRRYDAQGPFAVCKHLAEYYTRNPQDMPEDLKPYENLINYFYYDDKGLPPQGKAYGYGVIDDMAYLFTGHADRLPWVNVYTDISGTKTYGANIHTGKWARGDKPPHADLILEQARRRSEENDFVDPAEVELSGEGNAAPSSHRETEHENMMLLRFYVQGSVTDPYAVTFKGEGKSLTARCSCPAGRKRLAFCKHIASLLKGDTSKIAGASDDIELLVNRAEGSPLMEKAKTHTPSKQKIQPLENINSLSDISALIQPLLSQTTFWSEHTSAEDGSEFLTVYMRKVYKNGKPYKNPTRLVTISYQPVIHALVWDEDADGEMQKTTTEKRTLPYLVDSTNYGKIETAGANFIKKLEDTIKALRPLPVQGPAEMKKEVERKPQECLSPEELQRRNTERKAAMRAKPATPEVLEAAQKIISALEAHLPDGVKIEGQDRAKYYAISLMPGGWLCRFHYKTKNKYIEINGSKPEPVQDFSCDAALVERLSARLPS
ncbi:SWIM zinc finger family protein [Desulfosarcina sp. OttesenSCG-928-G10]|nr:SWIM zinc finger family protein [Desulfosarcina sp. OttesenSCG-928-G10]MDL2321309.1 SWIM zinc finger family protein [Desulfosarcina sp. OttesenSCG-928-B08]